MKTETVIAECSKCHRTGTIYSYPVHRQCKDCRNEYRLQPHVKAREFRTHRDWYYNRGGKAIVRKNTKAHRERTGYPGYSDENKKHARSLAQAAIRHGKLERKFCERCAAVKAEAHHDDYSKPLEVRFLCSLCHRLEHEAIRRGER